MPSITPTVNALVPSTVTMNRGSKLWIISDETSINKLTKPKAQTPRGIRLKVPLLILTGIANHKKITHRQIVCVF
jgi:hypothetical protein